MRTDDQVAGVVNAANQGEVEQGQAALEKVQRDEVKEFAQQMIAMHSAAQQKAEGLLKTKNIQPAESPVSQQLASDSENLVRDIRDAATDRVDALYMDAQVNVHRRVLEIIDRELLPNVQDEELKADLLATRKTVEAHLAKAESIVNGL